MTWKIYTCKDCGTTVFIETDTDRKQFVKQADKKLCTNCTSEVKKSIEEGKNVRTNGQKQDYTDGISRW
jgi:hypothetical protein